MQTLLFAPYEEKLVIWNITQSIKQGTTVIDKIIPYAWRDANGGACYNEMYLQGDSILLARVDPFPLSDEESTLLFIRNGQLTLIRR